MSPGALEASATGMNLDPASIKREEPSAGGMRFVTHENFNNVASGRAPVKEGTSTRPRDESVGSAHGAYRQDHDASSPRASGVGCRACGSHRHMTKECHVPSVDGTVVICPFHDCTVLDRTGPPAHPLDGLKRHDPGDRVRAPLYCDKVMRYKMAVQTRNTTSIRNTLPQMFRELVLNRKRKPCCRVVDPEVCPINLAIEYSWEFCHGKMPVEMAGIWPYTMRDAMDPAIQDKLRQYDELGWEGMPPGELEAKSWDQIKREYAEGIIPPQVHSKNKPYYQTRTSTPTAADLGDTEAHLHAPGADIQPQAVDEDGNGQRSSVQEGAAQSQDKMKMDGLLQMVGDLSEKVDALSALPEQVRALSEKADSLSALTDEVRALSEKVDALSSLPEQLGVLWEKKKDVLRKIMEALL